MMHKTRLQGWPADSELESKGRLGLKQLQASLHNAGLESPAPAALDALGRVFCCSTFATQALVTHPQLLAELFNIKNIKGSDSLILPAPINEETASDEINKSDPLILREADTRLLTNATDESAFMRVLRGIRRREMLRIALRDLLGQAGLDETLLALSALADFCIQQAHIRAYDILVSRHGEPFSEQGEPQSLIVLAMGKLGGRELNYSSDIDLILAYPEDGQTQGPASERSIDNQTFFTQQAQWLIRFLHETTEDGFVFRVDTRLRPFGDSGALVISFDFMESYYQNQGREWERYAMIKARPVCGAEGDAQYLMSMLRPFVYRRYLDYGAFESLRAMKTLIEREVSRKRLQDNIKLGSGGIREIEFIGQAFQLIRGGRDREFRRREIMQVLTLLGERELLSADTVESLLAAYRFLRDAENRLQMVADQQTHSLPKSAFEQARLAYAMGYDSWEDFSAGLRKHRENVSRQFAEIFFATEKTTQSGPQAAQLLSLLEGKLGPDEARAIVQRLGFPDSEIDPALEEIRKFSENHVVRHISQTASERLTQLLPLLFEAVVAGKTPALTLGRVLHLLQAVIQRSVYLALLAEYPEVLRQVVNLFAASGWVADYFRQQPILLDSLLDSRLLYRLPGREALAAELKTLIRNFVDEDPEQRLNALRHFKQEQVLRVAAVDVTEQLPLMKVSDQLTWLAEAIVGEMFVMATDEAVAKYGQPACRIGAKTVNPEMAVIAYGKLGGIELGYGSDLDLVFLHNSEGEDQQTLGERHLANEVFFARLAQRLIHLLSVQTVGGVLYEVDVRLRPDGGAGMLVSSLERFAEYQRTRAWTWEHQALVRARPIVGSGAVREAFARLRHEILTRPRDLDALRADIRAMRDRMRAELAKSRQGEFDLKQDRGGIADIEFMVQYGVLAWAKDYPALTEFTDNIRILEQFGGFGLLPARDADLLISAYKHLRENTHRLALRGDVAVLQDVSASQSHIDAVAGIWLSLIQE
jgi:glutamate-ammonia-ligase adenylyltransferase